MSEVLTKLETLAISQRETAQKFGQCQIAIVLTMAKTLEYSLLLHIMCGYQCDKAVNKNDTREVI